MSVAHYTANSLAEFVEQICKIKNSLRQNGAEFNEVSLFRGQADESYELLPSLARPIISESSESLIHEERNLIEMAKFRLPSIFQESMRPLERLALLQHYGVPTRLLDITENAFVALYFACCSSKTTNGEVIVFKNNEVDITNHPIVDAICDSYRFALGGTSFSDFFENINIQPYFLEQKLSNKICFHTAAEKSAWIYQCCKKHFFVYAPIHSKRQQAQSGRYLLFSNDYNFLSKNQYYFTSYIMPLPKSDDNLIAARIQIPSILKEQFLKDLSIFGISKDVLFCDDIGTICSSITSTYQQKVRYMFNSLPEKI